MAVSEVVKRLWDEDTAAGSNLRVVLLGSAPLLVQRGLAESLAGRFELVRAPHWSFAEMRAAFGWDIDSYVYHGGYPGAALLIDEHDRWVNYILDSLIETICFQATPSPLDLTADNQVSKLAQIGETLPYYTVFAARPAEILKRDMDWAIEHIRRGIGEPELEGVEEITKLNPRIDEAYAALEWHLTRDPSAGLPIPVSNTSFFLYKQSPNIPLTIPGIAVIYTVDLDEVVICRVRFEPNEEDEECCNEAEANEGVT